MLWLTRPQADSERFARLLHPDIPVLIAPLLTIQHIVLSDAALQQAQDVDALFVSSRQALAVLTQSALLNKPLYTVGKETAAAARAAGFQQVTCAGQDVASAQALLRTLPITSLFYAAGRDITTALTLGCPVIQHTVYDAVAVTQLPRSVTESNITAVALFSTRSARMFTHFYKALDLQVFSLSPAIAAVCTVPADSCHISPVPESKTLADMINIWYGFDR